MDNNNKQYMWLDNFIFLIITIWQSSIDLMLVLNNDKMFISVKKVTRGTHIKPSLCTFQNNITVTNKNKIPDDRLLKIYINISYRQIIKNVCILLMYV